MFIICMFPCSLWSQPYFTEVAQKLGIQHSYTGIGAGGGVSFVDFNQDGWDDITLATGLNEPLIFLLNEEGTFKKIDLSISDSSIVKQILWVDFDNDGDLDLFCTGYESTNKLYEHIDYLEFIDRSEEIGLNQDTFRNVGASFADIDRDGLLDIYFVRRSIPGQNLSTQNILLRNTGEFSFEDVTDIYNVADPNRLPFCNVIADFNNDRWPDIYIANDRESRNTMFLNQKEFFLDVSEVSGSNLYMQGMNTAISDYNQDGDFDIYITNNEIGNRFLQNKQETNQNPFPVFQEISTSIGTEVNGYCWGANFLDANNDGLEDLYVSGVTVHGDQSSAFLIQDQSNQFTQVLEGFEADTVRSFCNAIGDFDNNGFPDIMVQNSLPHNGQLWQNNGGLNHYLKVELEGVLSNRDAIGSRIEIFYGDRYQQKYLTCGIGYLGQHSKSLHFGLSDNTLVDSLKVHWPTGHTDIYFQIDADRRYHFTEGNSTDGEIIIDPDVTLWSQDTTVIDTISRTDILVNKDNIFLFPNPTQSHIEVALLHKDWVICSILHYDGRKANMVLKNGRADVRHLPSGLYYVRICNSNQYKLIPFIKK